MKMTVSFSEYVKRENISAWITPGGGIYVVDPMRHSYDFPSAYEDEYDTEDVCVKVSDSLWTGLYLCRPTSHKITSEQKKIIKKMYEAEIIRARDLWGVDMEVDDLYN